MERLLAGWGGQGASTFALSGQPKLIGRPRVHVQVSAEVTKPLEDRKFDGIFTITTELSPIASPAYEVGRQTEQEVLLSRALEKAIRRSRAIDTESLCIISGAKCWSVRADVHVLDSDGDTFADRTCRWTEKMSPSIPWQNESLCH
jgi:exosome complex component RRP45